MHHDHYLQISLKLISQLNFPLPETKVSLNYLFIILKFIHRIVESKCTVKRKFFIRNLNCHSILLKQYAKYWNNIKGFKYRSYNGSVLTITL